MHKILCIDDNPEQIINISTNESLQQILEGIFKTGPYKMVFETDGGKGIEIAASDNNIKLVILDILFTGQRKQGDEIAKELLIARPELKVIVLTTIIPSGVDKGKKTSFGHKRNVVHYVIKMEPTSPDMQNKFRTLSHPDIQEKLKNLCHAIIDDYNNEKWIISYDDLSVINLYNKLTKKTIGINIPSMSEPALKECMKNPNKPVSLPTKEYGKNLFRVHNNINENVREKTDWNTWGLFTKEGCTKGQLKLLIGTEPLPISSILKDPYVTQSQLESFRKEIDKKLSLIEQAIKKIPTSSQKS